LLLVMKNGRQKLLIFRTAEDQFNTFILALREKLTKPLVIPEPG
jgi:hypothetical protein